MRQRALGLAPSAVPNPPWAARTQHRKGRLLWDGELLCPMQKHTSSSGGLRGLLSCCLWLHGSLLGVAEPGGLEVKVVWGASTLGKCLSYFSPHGCGHVKLLACSFFFVPPPIATQKGGQRSGLERVGFLVQWKKIMLSRGSAFKRCFSASESKSEAQNF